MTPAEARRLVAEFPAEGVPVEFSPANDVSVALNGLPLNGLKSLDAETAAALAGYQGQLVLGGVTALDAATAKALTSGKAFSIHLHGLTALDADTARVLVASRKVPGWLSGLTTLDEATAGLLAKFQGGALSLEGLAMIDIPLAEALADYSGRLVLADSCRARFLENDLSPETARLAAEVSGGVLPDVTALDSPDSVAIARGLAAYRGPLALPHLKKLGSSGLLVALQPGPEI